jgi:hypothetical protein
MLLLVVLAATPLVYAYREGKQPQEKTYELTDWSKATRVFTATHAARLREKPDPEAPLVAELPFGSEVKILSPASDEVTVKDRTDRWYRVASEGKAGYLFGNVLTTARFEDDFDGDGVKELASVAFTADFKIRVRFFEPKEKTETWVDVEPAGGAFLGLTGGYAYPDALGKAKAGLPLVHVDSHVEACADFADFWVSYTGGKAQLAMTLRGIADPPAMASYQVEFQKGLAVVKREQAEEEDKPPKKWTERWVLDGGVFVPPAKR